MVPKNCIGRSRPSPSIRLSARGKWIVWSARFAGIVHRALRFTTGLFVSLLFAVAAFAQEAPSRQRIRFLDGKAELCEIVSADADGILLRLEGVPKPVRFKWWQLDAEDALVLRSRMVGAAGPAPAASPTDLTVPGVRLKTLDGKTIEGVLLPGAPPRDYWVKTSEGKFVVPVESVESREELRLELQRVYVPEEVLGILMGRIKPSTAEDYDRLGGDLLRVKLQERAVAAFKMAELLRHPDWPEARMHSELVRLRERVEDLALRRSVFQAQESCLAGDYDAALAQIDVVEKAMLAQPEAAGALPELRRLRAMMEDHRGRARDERIVQETYRTIEAFLKARAMDRSLEAAAARTFVEGAMPAEVLAHVRWRFNFSPDDAAVKLAFERRPAEAMFKHSYDEASWPVLKPEARSLPEWWSAASDESRYKLLKGLYIEKHLQVIRSELKSCGHCGGSGLVENAVCPSCAGLKSQRVLIYR